MNLKNIFLKEKYKKDVIDNFKGNKEIIERIVTEDDLEDLPECISGYLRYVGVVGKPVISNFYVKSKGKMRSKNKKYFSFSSEQYNFFKNPARLFFMIGDFGYIKILGYHRYINNKASMEIKLLGLFPIVKHSGDIMDEAETVTIFNDICIMAPAFLIDKNIKWYELDKKNVRAIYTNGNISIEALLCFNEDFQLINFISYDRTDVSDMKKYRFSTPVSNYKNFNGYNLPSYGEMVWNYDDGEFIYGKIWIDDLKYNLNNQISF